MTRSPDDDIARPNWHQRRVHGSWDGHRTTVRPGGGRRPAFAASGWDARPSPGRQGEVAPAHVPLPRPPHPACDRAARGRGACDRSEAADPRMHCTLHGYRSARPDGHYSARPGIDISCIGRKGMRAHVLFFLTKKVFKISSKSSARIKI